MKSTITKPFGFWADNRYSPLPVVRASIFDNAEIVSLLRALETRISIGQLKAASLESYRGLSFCRICGCTNGNGEFTFGEYQWPSGLTHYLEDHNIEPPPELRELLKYHKLKFKIQNTGAHMDLFPFAVMNTDDDKLLELWESKRSKGQTFSRVHARVLSTTDVKLVVVADGESEPVYNQSLTVGPEVLADLIYERKYTLAEQEYKEREHFYRAHEIRKLMSKMFGD